MRKILFLIVLMIFPLAASAGYVDVNGIKYILNPVLQTAEVSYTYLNKQNYSGDIVIPEAITQEGVDYPVTSVAASAFLDCEKVTSIKLPNSMKTIGSSAFAGCTNVSSISIPHGVTSIGSNAFYKCINLKSIILPNSLTTIERWTFYGCSGLTSLTIPEGVTTISNSAFHSCTSLKTVIFPSTLSSIEYYAFLECTGLRDVYCYAETVPNVDGMVFGCRFTLHVPEGSVYSYMRNSAWNFLTIVAIGAPVKKTETYYFTGVSNDGLVSNNPWGGGEKAFWSYVSGSLFWSSGASAVGARCSVYSRVYTWSKETYPEVIQKVTINAGAWSDGPTSLKLNNREVSLKTMTTSAYAGDESRIKFDDYVFENVITSDNKGHLLLDYITSGQADIFIRSITIEYVEGGGCDMSEIPSDNDFYAATSFLCERGVLYGSRDDGKYSVEEKLLRKHLANITFRGLFTLNGREIPSTFVSDQYPAVYDDLKSDALYYRAAKTLLYLDYGDDITPFDRDRDGFFPDYSESRINVLKELMEAFNIEPDTEGTDNPFPDDSGIAELAETSPIRMGYVRQAAKLGIITTEHTEFHPFVECLRGEAFLMLARIIQKIEAGEIADPNPQESDFFDPYGPEPYAVLSNNNTELKFYYDTLKKSRRGIHVGSVYSSPSWSNKSVTTIVIDPSFANCTKITRTAFWFSGFSNVTSITGFQYLKTDKVKSMREMFSGCSKLTSLDLSSFNTQKVTDMSAMFNGCSGLRTIYVGADWSTAAVTSSEMMFADCHELLGGAGTQYNENHTNHTYAHFDRGTENPGYFTDKNTVPYAVLSDDNTVLTFYFDDQKEKRNGMDVGPFKYSMDIVGGYAKFYVNSGWYAQRENITKVIFDASFAGCSTLTSTAYWFYGLKNLSSITGIGNLKTDNVTSMLEMFSSCSSLTSLDVSGFKTDNVTNMSSMFSGCSGLTSLDVSGFKTDNVTNMSSMFSGCSGLTSLDLSNFNTANVTKMVSMFDGNSSLKSIDMTGFKTDKVSYMTMMFYNCSSLTTICAGEEWITTNVNDDGIYMFNGCTNLVGGAGTTYDANHTNHTYAHIDGGTDNPGYFTVKPEGDLNGDGKVDVADIVVLLSVRMGGKMYKLTDADLNHDKKVDAADVVTLVKMIMSQK